MYKNNTAPRIAAVALATAAIAFTQSAAAGTLKYTGPAYAPWDGSFAKVTSGDWAARNLANAWLGIVNAGSYTISQDLSVWQQNIPGSTQDLAVFAPVPEPETYAMILAGLGIMGFVARRRRSARLA